MPDTQLVTPPIHPSEYGYIFEFDVNHIPRFHHNMHKMRCQCINASNGLQCSRTTTIGCGYCWSHMRTQKHLKIAPSKIPNAGLGLFAYNPKKGPNEIIFKSNTKITDYDGEVVTKETLDQRYGGDDFTAPYGIEVSAANNVYEDGAVRRGIGSMANHASKRKVNARLSTNRNHTRATVKATKHIRNNEEILVNYGSAYRFQRNVTAKTRYGKLL
jgi:SET domain